MAVFFWVNEYEPYFIGSMQVASSGKVAAVYTLPVGNVGRPMKVNYRKALNTEVVTWKGYAGTVFTILEQQVIFAFNNPLTYVNEILGDEADPAVTYGGSLDYYRGTMNLVIVG